MKLNSKWFVEDCDFYKNILYVSKSLKNECYTKFLMVYWRLWLRFRILILNNSQFCFSFKPVN